MTDVAGPRGVTFDASALIALDRGNRHLWARLRAAEREKRLPVVPAPVVAQAWRTPRQANLARALRHCRIEATDAELAKAAGELCERSGTVDVVDAIVVASAGRRADIVLTSDLLDISALAEHVDGVTVQRV